MRLLIIPFILLTPLAASAEGLLRVSSDPKGATISVDGKLTKLKTPAQLLLSSGGHKITLNLSGYQSQQRQVMISDGAVAQLSLALQQEAPVLPSKARQKPKKPLVTGRLTLETDLKGADIFLNGKSTGLKTPITVRIPVGRHVIRLAHGQSYVDQTIVIHKGNHARIRVNLKPHVKGNRSADPSWPARHQACLKQCKRQRFEKPCQQQYAGCTKGCPGRSQGRVVNPGQYYSCEAVCKDRRGRCLVQMVSNCKEQCHHIP